MGLLAGLVLAGGCSEPAGVGATDEVPVARNRLVVPPPAPTFDMQPLPLAPAANAAPETGLALAPDAAVEARILVITADGTNSTFAAVTSALKYLGTPFDVLNATTDPPLTADRLATGMHGNYQAILLDTGELSVSGGSAFSDEEWMTLASYEATFGVRRVAVYTAPSSHATYGLTPAASGANPAQAPIAARCTPTGATVLVGANCDQPVTIDAGFAYPAQAADSATVPLLVDAAGNVYAAIRTFGDGREALTLTFSQSPSAIFSLQLMYGLVHWATRGLFIGEKHVYASPQIDDMFLASTIYTGGTYRCTDADLQAFADWQNGRRAQPVAAGFRAAFAANGAGSAARANDSLTSKAVAFGDAFAWISHTWDHQNLNAMSYADALVEFTRNDQYLRMLGFPVYETVNAVTPEISGLGNPNAMQAMFDAGIRQIVSDSSAAGQANPSPNAGFHNALVPQVLEIPRRPTDLYFNVSQPPEWIAEYNVLNTTSATYEGMIASESARLLRYMLQGENDPWMFHQANIRDIGGGHSLLSDLLGATLDRYAAVATFPVVSPPMEDLEERVERRMQLNASGASATIGPGPTMTVRVTTAAKVPVTGLCTPGGERYGGQPIGYVKLGDGQSATLSTADCNPGGSSTGTGGSTGGSGWTGEGGTTGGADGTAGSPGTSVGAVTGTPPNDGACGCGITPSPPAGLTALLLGMLAAVAATRRPRR